MWYSSATVVPQSFNRLLLICLAVLAYPSRIALSRPFASDEESRREGGGIAVALRTEPRTLNPILSIDVPSREVIGSMHADLIHINRQSQLTEPALASDWKISPDQQRYVLHLRRGLRFSDGVKVDADDVLFSFELYLDPSLHSPQRDLLLIDGKAIELKKVDDYTIEFVFPKPYAAAERLFDGLAILPKHLLAAPYRDGKLAQWWSVANSGAEQIAGLGPFRFKEYAPGQRLVLERNPYYWKHDQSGVQLPYVQTLTFVFVPNEDAQVLRFLSSETHLVERLSATNFDAIERREKDERFRLKDLGPGLESVFLLLNLNELGPNTPPSLSAKQGWFRDENFRIAISLAADRQSLVRLAYGSRADALWGHVSPGNRTWFDANVPRVPRSLEKARDALSRSGFSWNPEGGLVDVHGQPVEFTIITSSSSPERTRVATLLKEDLGLIGMKVSIVPLEFRSMVDRVLNSKEYEAAIMNFASGDTDPTSEMNVWLSSGSTHLWNLTETKPLSPWQEEIDRLMKQQMSTVDHERRKVIYNRVQQLIATHVPVIFLISPHVLVAAGSDIGNFKPGILYPYALWNVEELFFQSKPYRPDRD